MLPTCHVDESGDGPRLNAFHDKEMLFMCRFSFSGLFIFVRNLGLVFLLPISRPAGAYKFLSRIGCSSR